MTLPHVIMTFHFDVTRFEDVIRWRAQPRRHTLNRFKFVTLYVDVKVIDDLTHPYDGAAPVTNSAV